MAGMERRGQPGNQEAQSLVPPHLSSAQEVTLALEIHLGPFPGFGHLLEF